MIELGFKSIGVNNSSDTLVTLINQIFNYWIENENFEIFAAESELINFVFLVV